MKNLKIITAFYSTLRTRLFGKFFSGKDTDYIIVALGDSTIEGIGATEPGKAFAPIVYEAVKSHKKNAKFFNFGAAGAKVQDVVNFQLADALRLKPDLILLSIGANDVIKPVKTFQFDRNYKNLISSLSQNTKALIVVNNIPDFSIAPAVPRPVLPWFNLITRKLNRSIQKYTQEAGGILIDLYSQSKIFKGYRELISDDGFHPSDLGYALWGNTIITKLHPLIV
jgi:acyl-CoA thioesterase I